MTRLFAGTAFDIPPTCDDCGKLQSECICSAEQKAAAKAARQRDADRLSPGEQKARVNVENRKGGRKVTVVTGLTAKANDLPELLTKLQAVCGTGGTVKAKDDLIELQGDHADVIRKKLREIGYRL
ncbi:translation initiation factor Sui1 [Rubripirellula amarantea]|uniref:Translation initiation factor Sui1 n=1 Tax=Rubripirellula amarantea TaxID=2527999 RepID=A0A5C5WV38_9BACT|nr:translation initiation factor [Rubripirellula amarantea]TWT54516.1 translation initiation factor Sui1 [Rubripirellula amarantea]